tara:strand:+ start:94 stop:636 length:543 start_codon:yes stop_codon:yes gene_type:complete
MNNENNNNNNNKLLYTVIEEINSIIKENPNVNPENVSLKFTEILTEKEISKVKDAFKDISLKIKEKLESDNASVSNVPENIISGILLGGEQNVNKYLSGEYKGIADYAYETINMSQFMPKNNPEIISLISNNKELRKQLNKIHVNEEKLITANNNNSDKSKKQTLDENLKKYETKNKVKV